MKKFVVLEFRTFTFRIFFLSKDEISFLKKAEDT